MTKPMPMQDLAPLFARIPHLAARPFADWRVAPLPGLTNHSLAVSPAGGGPSYVLRLPGPAAGAYLSRVGSLANAAAAARLGLTPAALWADARTGIMLLPFLAETRMLAGADLANPATAADLGRLFARLHRSGIPFEGEIDPFAAADRYLALGAAAALGDLRVRAAPLQAALKATVVARVPSHIDANPANILRHADGRLTLIDWEFSSMADPCWDLATLVIEGAMGAACRSALLVGYGLDDTLPVQARLSLMALALHLVAATWAGAERALGNDHPDITGLEARHRAALETGLAPQALDPLFAAVDASG